QARRGDDRQAGGEAHHRRGQLPGAQARGPAEGTSRPLKRLLAAAAALLSIGAAPEPQGVALDALLAEKPAATLDAYRLFTDEHGRQPAAGVTPYALNTPLFSDYAEKARYVFLPPGKS